MDADGDSNMRANEADDDDTAAPAAFPAAASSHAAAPAAAASSSPAALTATPAAAAAVAALSSSPTSISVAARDPSRSGPCLLCAQSAAISASASSSPLPSSSCDGIPPCLSRAVPQEAIDAAAKARQAAAAVQGARLRDRISEERTMLRVLNSSSEVTPYYRLLSPPPARLISGFQRAIGVGEFSLVFEALRLSDGVRVAIKAENASQLTNTSNEYWTINRSVDNRNKLAHAKTHPITRHTTTQHERGRQRCGSATLESMLSWDSCACLLVCFRSDDNHASASQIERRLLLRCCCWRRWRCLCPRLFCERSGPPAVLSVAEPRHHSPSTGHPGGFSFRTSSPDAADRMRERSARAAAAAQGHQTVRKTTTACPPQAHSGADGQSGREPVG